MNKGNGNIKENPDGTLIFARKQKISDTGTISLSQQVARYFGNQCFVEARRFGEKIVMTLSPHNVNLLTHD